PLGDYVAGPDHTLPTGGTARFSNPLGVYDFQKHSSVISYTPQGLLADAPAVQAMAQAEGLWAHALSAGLRVRLAKRGEQGFADAPAACEDATRIAWPRTLDAPGALRLPGYEG
ncbi:MAG: histidinol dehydrogenase, partial [Coriobacteriaceae bacterium]|nr:histidinol dehydrogenase [Coriobacteriaceae bacterium]